MPDAEGLGGLGPWRRPGRAVRHPGRSGGVAKCLSCAGHASIFTSHACHEMRRVMKFCSEINNILFEWSVFERHGAALQHLSFVSSAKDPAIFRLPSYALESNTNYKVRVSCRRHGHLYNSTASVNIRVKRGKVYAQINKYRQLSTFNILFDNLQYLELPEYSVNITLKWAGVLNPKRRDCF